ncbi:NAD(P)-binding protein, partial [Gymnopus androsaceus JB14]
SSRSIGASIAIHLASEGAMVMVNYVGNADAAASVVSQINSKADVSTIAGAQTLLDAALKEFGRIDILVLNAGIMGSKVLADVDEAFFDNHMNINVKGPLFLVKAAAPLMTEGSIINQYSYVPQEANPIFLLNSLTAQATVPSNSLVSSSLRKGVYETCWLVHISQRSRHAAVSP